MLCSALSCHVCIIEHGIHILHQVFMIDGWAKLCWRACRLSAAYPVHICLYQVKQSSPVRKGLHWFNHVSWDAMLFSQHINQSTWVGRGTGNGLLLQHRSNNLAGGCWSLTQGELRGLLGGQGHGLPAPRANKMR